MISPAHLLVDLDDTLYAYAPSAEAAEAAAFAEAARELDWTPSSVARAYADARDAVKGRLGQRAAAHARLLYFHELVHRAGRVDLLASVRRWDRRYWSAFLAGATLRPFALELLSGVAKRGGKVAVVTDLVLEVQLWKLEHFGLMPYVHALVASEEVPEDKPRPEIFQLALHRIGDVPPASCVMVGDHEEKDGGGARALGIRYFRVDTGNGQGESLEAIAHQLGVAP
ncbi:MAG: HAD-IA family hydrolase [Myxococcales bacterium]|nr:HAD-IA family hydrolase [Myxococcales bacterium]